jgi:hypothetical protein
MQEKSGRGLILGYYGAILLAGLRKTSVGIVDISTEIPMGQQFKNKSNLGQHNPVLFLLQTFSAVFHSSRKIIYAAVLNG